MRWALLPCPSGVHVRHREVESHARGHTAHAEMNAQAMPLSTGVAAGTPGTHLMIHHVSPSLALPESIPSLSFPSVSSRGPGRQVLPAISGVSQKGQQVPCAPQKQAGGREWGLVGRGLGPVSPLRLTYHPRLRAPPSLSPSQRPRTPAAQCPRFPLRLRDAAGRPRLGKHHPGRPRTACCGCGVLGHLHPRGGRGPAAPSPHCTAGTGLPGSACSCQPRRPTVSSVGGEAVSPTFQKGADAATLPPST